jgi:L-ribulokinase
MVATDGSSAIDRHPNRNSCTAGYKAIWQKQRLSSKEFLSVDSPLKTSWRKKLLPDYALRRKGGGNFGNGPTDGLKAGKAVAVANVVAHCAYPR